LWLIASVAAIVAGALLIGVVRRLSNDEFNSAFLANFLSTLAGILLGVPVAIWLALRQAKEQRDAAEQEADRISRQRRIDVLTAIRKELIEDRATLTNDRGDQDAGWSFAVPFLMDEVWAAMSDGGQLEWITDTEVLRRLARAHVFIRTIIYLEKQAFEVIHYPGTRAVLEIPWTAGQQPNDLPSTRIAAYLTHQRVVCIAAIDEALELVDPLLPERPEARMPQPE
jgi:hypothetical protein